MEFYERFIQLCEERGVKPQSKLIQEVAGVSSPAIQGWKDNAVPKIVPVIKLAIFFHVSTDYMLGLTDVRTLESESVTEQEQLLLDIYRNATVEGQMQIIATCINEKRKDDGHCSIM